MLKIITKRLNNNHKARLIDISNEAYNWLRQFSKDNNVSMSLMLELMIRSRALNKRLDLLIDYDLYKDLVQRPSIQNPDIVQPLE